MVTKAQVHAAADELASERGSVRAVTPAALRRRCGGSPREILRLLAGWREERRAARRKPPAAPAGDFLEGRARCESAHGLTPIRHLSATRANIADFLEPSLECSLRVGSMLEADGGVKVRRLFTREAKRGPEMANRTKRARTTMPRTPLDLGAANRALTQRHVRRFPFGDADGAPSHRSGARGVDG
jgi:hypothetical protein